MIPPVWAGEGTDLTGYIFAAALCIVAFCRCIILERMMIGHPRRVLLRSIEAPAVGGVEEGTQLLLRYQRHVGIFFGTGSVILLAQVGPELPLPRGRFLSR
jgi:hypothetical protein